MYQISAETIISGDLETVWAVAVDVDSWAMWDPHEQEARLDGAFEVGGTGWSKPNGGPGTTWTITDVIKHHRWTLLRSAYPPGHVQDLGGAQQEVAEQTGADRMMTSKLVRTMEERGLLVRRPHASDARSLLLSLTPAGRDLVRQATQAARDVDALFFGAESATLRATLRRIAEHRGPNDQ